MEGRLFDELEEIEKGISALNEEELPEEPVEEPTEEVDENILIVRLMTDDDESSDALISAYLKIAGRKIIHRAFPYKKGITEVPEEYKTLQCEIAAYLINKRGAEGQISHTEGGVTRMYENADIPASMLKEVTPYCGVPMNPIEETEEPSEDTEDEMP